MRLIMNYEIIEIVYNDPNYLVRVVMDENSSIFLNFDHIPSQEEVNDVVENIKSTRTY